MRVTYFDHVAQLSGGELALLRLLRHASSQIEATVILGEQGPLQELLESEGIRVRVLPLPPVLADVRVKSGPMAAINAWRRGHLYRYLRALREELIVSAPDIVHTNSMKAHLLGGLAARSIGIPAVWHLRDIISDDYMSVNLQRLTTASLRTLPSGLIANSPSTLRAAPIPRRLPRLILPSIIEGPARPLRPREGGTTVIGSVGRLVPWKGHELLLRSLAMLPETAAFEVRIAGAPILGDEAWAKYLRDLTHELGLTERVSWLGHVSDVYGFLAEVDVLVHSSIIPEPFGQTLFEGMSTGACVVAPLAGGPADYLNPGVDSLTYPLGDIQGLSAQLLFALEHRDLRYRLGEAARQTALQFRPEEAVNRLLRFYRSWQ